MESLDVPSLWNENIWKICIYIKKIKWVVTLHNPSQCHWTGWKVNYIEQHGKTLIFSPHRHTTEVGRGSETWQTCSDLSITTFDRICLTWMRSSPFILLSNSLFTSKPIKRTSCLWLTTCLSLGKTVLSHDVNYIM